ncbi:uncharacterized protein GIQ15_04475 [Arthroderma uncinatum]|uniref:uncharacterized protein n=1 Tax=Arthroderma uncinatum TaxID=74035 RepID=UPI00144A5CE1|nr:uncharacterized protein GIQ15_04475 [Arthroderma uncinatum]KAF3481716.1 hypothetical protein GIQ15_04475 [Arthroderma uncinatum]
MGKKAEKITCYSYEGNKAYPNNVKCPNSDSCCETVEQCRPDRLCTSKDDPKTLIRAPCVHRPWTNSCAQVCLYDKKDTLILPRAVICEQPGPANGSYCCDDSQTCCIDKAGFFLDDNGLLIGRANETENHPTRTPSQIGVPASSTEPTSTTSRRPSSLTHNEFGLATTTKIGIGVGVGVLVLLLIIAGTLLFLRRMWRKKRNRRSMSPLGEQRCQSGDEEVKGYVPAQEDKHEFPGEAWTPELDGNGKGDARNNGPPSELPSTTQVNTKANAAELPGEQHALIPLQS